jgi:2-amino-4-hydroxy-6-hydroxymethyldihydropteridine diphosphokinase
VTKGWTRAVIALGTNQGDREELLANAVADLAATEGVRVLVASSVIDSIALTESGFDETEPAYLNQVVVIESAWPATHLLDKLHEIEARHGRLRDHVRWAPRTLDLDIITFGDLTLDTPTLTIPHPRAHERHFVLAPWLEIDPEATLPGHGPVRELVAGLESSA